MRNEDLERTRRIWNGLKSRCLNAKNKRWPSYGGRGITVDSRWLTFTGFLEDMGMSPPWAQIDRIDNDGGYTKMNCHWATREGQQNNMRNNHWLTRGDGKRQTVSQWARELGIHGTTLLYRMKRMTVEEALTLKRGGSGNWIPRRLKHLAVTCRWCGHRRYRINRGEFCYKCRKNEAGEPYTRVYLERKRNASS